MSGLLCRFSWRASTRARFRSTARRRYGLLPVPALLVASVQTLAPFTAPDLSAQTGRRVLVLSAVGRNWSGQQIFDQALNATLTQGLSNVELYYEYLDAEHFGGARSQSALFAFLHEKYETLTPDLVFTFGVEACEFMGRHGATLFPGVPIVYFVTYCSITETDSPRRNLTGVKASLDFSATLDLALQLQPETRQVHVICGASDFDRTFEALARRDFARFQNRLDVVYRCGVPIARLEYELARLPARSIVFFSMMTVDSLGQRFTRNEALARVARAARVPVYGWFETFLEQGVLAARTYDLAAVTRQAGQMAVQILRGTPPANLPLQQESTTRTLVNARALRRFGIDERRVPPESIVLFRDPGPWQEYRWYILAASLVLLVQAGFIAALLVQRQRRQRAERDMLQSRAALRRSYTRIRQLARRLISAQELERTRIARELHDDVNQQVAALAIALSEVRRRIPSIGVDVHADLDRLQKRTAALVETVRDLSHELHPGTLRHAGLEPAIRGLCRDVGNRHGLRISLQCPPDLGRPNATIALTLYRVVQESLQNVVRHGHARRVLVRFKQHAQQIELHIFDNGQGFETARLPGAGLGLISMEERVRLSGGRLRIASRPGIGTRLRVRIPVPAFATSQPGEPDEPERPHGSSTAP